MGNVKVFRSTDYGAPALYGNAGYLIAVLDACLVNGYGTNTITSLTHSNGTVTAVTAIPHGLQAGSKQTIAGVNETGYNGEFSISVVNATTFTYQAAGISVNTATGTITTRSVQAGWTKSFSGTNLAAYRPGAGPQHYLRVDDTQAQLARVVGYETMSDVNTGTGPFPTTGQQSGGLYWRRSSTTDATNARTWIVVADDRTMYMWIDSANTLSYTNVHVYGFGQFMSNKPADAYSSFIQADPGNSYSLTYWGNLLSVWTGITNSTNYGFFAPRSYTQAGGSVPLFKITDYSKCSQTYIGGSGMIYPHPVDGGLWMKQLEIVEAMATGANNVIRGRMRGIYGPLHNMPLNHLDTFNGSGDLANKKFIALASPSSTSALHQFFIDISMTWET